MKASVARMQVFPTCRATTLQLAVTHPPRQQPPGPKTPSLIKPIIPFHQSKRLPREGRFLPAPPTNAGGPLGSLGTTSDDEQQPRPTILGHRFRFEDIYWYINAAYWSTLLLSILTDNKWLDAAAHFGNFVSAMTIASFFFTGWCAINWVLDVRRHLANSERKKRDAQGVLRYGWRALFWLGFVLWYAIDPVDAVVEWSATPGAIMCTYGLALAASSALQIGSWSFFGEPQIPRRMSTTGPYALLRHPQALGNMLFLVGFSSAGGSVIAAVAFIASFALYCASVLPREEAMLEQEFGAKYRHYKEKVPAFAWGLVLLLVLESVLMWRFKEYAIPIDLLSIPRGPGAPAAA